MHGGSSLLSNFYQCNLKIDNQNYISVEQYFQMKKSIFAENQEATKKVREVMEDQQDIEPYLWVVKHAELTQMFILVLV